MKGRTCFTRCSLPVFILLSCVGMGVADSPITSTDFYRAYMDIPQVVQAGKMTGLTEQLFDFLEDPNTPLDQAAAVVNSMSFGGHNANVFTYYLRNKYRSYDVNKLIENKSLPSRTLFILGYMKAMDRYFDCQEAEDLLKQAAKEIPSSFTVAAIYSIVKGQKHIYEIDDWCKIWKALQSTLRKFPKSKRDMRIEAVRIILEHMQTYRQYCSQ